MRRHILMVRCAKFAAALLLVLSYVLSSSAQARGTSHDPQTSSILSAEQRTARHFESLRKSPPQLLAFLLAMPKGGDLHNHLSGAIYAESYIQWASDSGLCVNTQTFTFVAAKSSAPANSASDANASTCEDPKLQRPAADALRDPVLYRNLIDALS